MYKYVVVLVNTINIFVNSIPIPFYYKKIEAQSLCVQKIKAQSLFPIHFFPFIFPPPSQLVYFIFLFIYLPFITISFLFNSHPLTQYPTLSFSTPSQICFSHFLSSLSRTLFSSKDLKLTP